MDRLAAGRYWAIWLPVGAVAVWALVRVLGVEGGHSLSAALAFTPYVALASVFVVGIAVAFANWPAALVALTASACLLAAVLPRALGGTHAAAPGEPVLRVLSTNIHRGKADPGSVVALVDRLHPQLLSVQELTPEFAASLRREGLLRRLPHAVLSVREEASGAGLYSSLPLREIRGSDKPSFRFRMPRAVLRLGDGDPIRVTCVHPVPPTVDAAQWRHGLESLPSAGTGAPWLLAGDFNATLDHAELRSVLDRGYTDAGDATGMGLEPTWPAGRTVPPLITIDHVLVDSRLEVLDYELEDVAETDHRAIFSEVGIP
jgi:endonuclease/exonuclease/phosphatase (EEP) superfamily protein YafD